MSRFFIYYNCREAMGNTMADTGASMRLGIKTLVKFGVCSEAKWPYEDWRFSVKPRWECYDEGLVHRIVRYYRLSILGDMLDCLSQGFPFGCGISVYSNFYESQVVGSGELDLPVQGVDTFKGGHGVLIVGNDDPTQRFIARNSFGASWGADGYFTLPYEYLTRRGLAGDFWTVRR
jgi:C1A family cysteine protease